MTQKKRTVVVHFFEEDWDLLLETLQMDSQSSAFDRELREEINFALSRIIIYKEGDG